MKFHWFLLLPICLLSGLLAGCNLSATEAENTVPAPQALFTSAAQTAEAMHLQRFGLTPSPPAPEVMIATAAAVTPTPTEPAPVITATLPGGPATAPAVAGVTPGGDKAEYVADVTIPDGTVFAPGESFQKTWRIANTGITTWTTAYELVFIDGDLLGAPASVPLPQEVKPGERVEITVDMIAPEAARSYVSYWKLRTPQGQVFGFGAAGTEAIWAKIIVGADSASGGPDATQAPSSNETVAGLTLSVDAPEFSGACPHSFLFTAQITLNKAAAIAYALEAGGSSGEVRTPPPGARNLSAGTHTLVFELTVPSDGAGWARLRLTQPGTLISNQVNFKLTCE